MKWSSIGNEAAVVGYNAQADYFFNHPASGYDSIGDGVSCATSSTSEQLSKEPNSLTVSGEVGTNPVLQASREQCIAFHTVDVLDIPSDTLQSIIQQVEPCPCCSTQASKDLRFQKQPDTANCYTQVTPVTDLSLQRDFSFVQQCCYDLETT